ncbi:MAG TPA: methyltransferase [Treponema sp.]|nr:methyltransferase [Treponema sp.]
MILSATLSKPVKNAEDILGRPYRRIKIRTGSSASGHTYFAEFFTDKQAFHEQMTEEQLSAFLKKHAGKTFRNCVERTETEEITILANKKGETTTLRKPAVGIAAPAADRENSGGTASSADGLFQRRDSAAACLRAESAGFNRIKNYLLPEGTPVPFLVLLGVMTPEGKVVAAKYDKFRQINRFLEFIDDVLPDVQKSVGNGRPLRIADFGCGKSYLTFAVYYYLTKIKKLAVEITGLDLKKDVIDYCNKTAEQLGCSGLTFAVGNIAEYAYEHDPDIVVTLHACDTATDYALDYAVKHNCTAILSVPCCQHELNSQITENKAAILSGADTPFAPFLKYGIIRERFAALATDALRAEYLENAGYGVQMLEFIDMEHTPKNLLIRAVKKSGGITENGTALHEAERLTAALRVSPTLRGLLQD